MPKVSIIVPVYNAEKYLEECAASILNQTIKDIELILVDDGSTDFSPALCDSIAARDSRVKVIHKANGRASSARNAGIRAAGGEFVAFVDADDWISPEMYETMLAQGADVCLCDFVRFQGDREFPNTHNTVKPGFYDRAQMIRDIFPHLVIQPVFHNAVHRIAVQDSFFVFQQIGARNSVKAVPLFMTVFRRL